MAFKNGTLKDESYASEVLYEGLDRSEWRSLGEIFSIIYGNSPRIFQLLGKLEIWVILQLLKSKGLIEQKNIDGFDLDEIDKDINFDRIRIGEKTERILQEFGGKEITIYKRKTS